MLLFISLIYKYFTLKRFYKKASMVASKLIKMEEGILLEEKDLSFNKNRKSVKIFITVS